MTKKWRIQFLPVQLQYSLFFLINSAIIEMFVINREKISKMKKTNDFGRDSIPLLVLKISIPFMFAQFVNVLYSIVDRIYVGNIPVTGADALPASAYALRS